MKKSLFLIGVLSLLLIGGVATSNAAVVGECADCHTMHQTETSAGLDLGTVDQYGALTLNTCIGCHTAPSTDPLADVDGNLTPYVYGTSLTSTLAGGEFTTETAAADDHGDAQHSLGATVEPVGTATMAYNAAGGLSCAGTSGCHGVEDTAVQGDSVAGGHHENTLKNGGAMTSGYRMLVVGTDFVIGSANETADYEEALNLADGTATGADSNTYSAGIAGADTTTATISRLCAKCHGDFHSQMGPSTEWTRHPTDAAIPSGWDIFDSVLTNSDNQNNPVGLSGTTRCVTCLSCHRAHGTDNNDILRWAYTTQDAGSGHDAGCLGCHNMQR